MDPSFYGAPEQPDDDLPAVVQEERRSRERRQQNTVRIFTGSVLVVALLYFARPVIIPIALALLFATFLSPLVDVLERTFLRRTGAVILSLTLMLSLLGMMGWYLASQTSSLAQELVRYSGNLEAKLHTLQKRTGGSFELMERMLERIAATGEPQERPDMKVRVIPEPKTLTERYDSVAPQIETLASAFLVIVLMFFLLQDRQKLRDRLLRLAGRAHLTITTQAIGEITHRISRYLLTLLLVNVMFGLAVGIGLAALRVPHAVLWGIVAALFRFVPYVGAVISAAFPTLLAFAVFPDWYRPLGVLLLFVVLDQLLGGFIEPMVVGHRVGVMPVALLVAAIFWGWLWGPVGLLLATPITVCLAVAGEFIPALRAFSILFSSGAALEDYLGFYNRLVLRDRGRALAIADRYAEEHSMPNAFTELFIPALTFALDELSTGRINKAQDHFIKDVIREAIIRIGDRNQKVVEPGERLVAASVAHERVSLGTTMLAQLMRAEGYAIDYFTDLSAAELTAFIEEFQPSAVMISCSGGNHLQEGLGTLRMLRARFPDVVLLAGGSAFAAHPDHAIGAGATLVATELHEARNALMSEMRQSKKRPVVTA